MVTLSSRRFNTVQSYLVSLFQPHRSLSMSKSQLAFKRVRGVLVDRLIVVRVLGAVTYVQSEKTIRKELYPYLLRLAIVYRRELCPTIYLSLFDWQRRRANMNNLFEFLNATEKVFTRRSDPTGNVRLARYHAGTPCLLLICHSTRSFTNSDNVPI